MNSLPESPQIDLQVSPISSKHDLNASSVDLAVLSLSERSQTFKQKMSQSTKMYLAPEFWGLSEIASIKSTPIVSNFPRRMTRRRGNRLTTRRCLVNAFCPSNHSETSFNVTPFTCFLTLR